MPLLLLLNPARVSSLDSPARAVIEAERDSRTAKGEHVRYLSLYAVPAKERADFLKALAFHLNSLSREAELVPVALVPGTSLVRIDLADYGMSRKVWERLAAVDPYFHAQIEVERETQEGWGHYAADGKTWVVTSYKTVKKKERVTAAAPWLPAREMGLLLGRCHTEAPLLRADWFFAQTAVQAGRRAGYYDFLGLKKRADFERLVGLDKEASIRVRKEIAAIVTDSGVTLNNRQIYRYQSLTGGYWITLDVADSKDKKNAVRLLNGDYADQHEAEEHYGFLSNGLFAYYLSKADGTQLDTAPDNVASDHTTTSNDHRLYAALSCIRCHVEGIRPIDDLARKLYRGAVALQSPDLKKLRRLRQLYLSNLPKHETRDRADFAETLKQVNGLTPEANARLYGRVWKEYVDTEVTLERAAAEVGMSAKDLLAGLKTYAAGTGGLDPILAFYLQDPPLTLRRDHFEEAFPLLQAAIRR